MKFDPNSPDPTVRALARLEQFEQMKALGITVGGKHVVPMAMRCTRCQGRRVVSLYVDANTTRMAPCPNCSKTPPPGASACPDLQIQVAA